MHTTSTDEQNVRLNDPPNWVTRISQNVQNIRQNYKLYHESHERLENGIISKRTKSSKSENPKKQFTGTLTLTITICNSNDAIIVLVRRVSVNGPGDLGSIPGRVIPKNLKMVLDTSLLNTQQYKVRIKGRVEQSRIRSRTLPYTSV